MDEQIATEEDRQHFLEELDKFFTKVKRYGAHMFWLGVLIGCALGFILMLIYYKLQQ